VRDGCLSSTVALTRVTSVRRGQLEISCWRGRVGVDACATKAPIKGTS